MSPPHSRPHSRAQSRSNSFNDPFESPTSERSRGSPPHPLDLSNATYDSYNDGVNTLPMPGSSGSDDSDDDDAVESALGLVMDRSSITSIMSMTADDRIELMEKVNKDLDRKLKEAEVTLMRKLSEHEAELEDIQVRLEESKSELTAAKKEEKELKNKEVCFLCSLRSFRGSSLTVSWCSVRILNKYRSWRARSQRCTRRSMQPVAPTLPFNANTRNNSVRSFAFLSPYSPNSCTLLPQPNPKNSATRCGAKTKRSTTTKP